MVTKKTLHGACLCGLALASSHAAFADVWINEFHYDNSGTDSNEKIEVMAPAGTSFAGWKIVLYNGSGGLQYATLNLSGTAANQCNGYGTTVATVGSTGMQNGSPDGIALVDAGNQVVQFLSYEGTFGAVDGPAAGRTSSAVATSETDTTPTGHSLRLTGTGNTYAQFAWAAPAASSFGACNAGQVLSGGGGGGSTALSNNVPVSNLSAGTNGQLGFTLSVPGGASNLVFTTTGGSGDADLYVKAGSAPTTSSYTCRSWNSGNAETCTIATPVAGTYHVLLNAYTSFNGVTLKGAYTTGGGGGGTGYYAGVTATGASALRSSLHPVIDDHTKIPYTASTTDTWDVLNRAEQDPLDTSRILDIYKNTSYAKAAGGNDFYNREHTWPNSLGFPNDGSTNYAYTDLHMLMASDIAYNSTRSNKPYDNCSSGCTEYPTTAYAGQGGGSGTYPGNSNWSNASVFQVWTKMKGNVARAMFYMDLRYEGGTHGTSGAAEPDLRLTDTMSLIAQTGGNASVAYMGRLSTLIQWHQQDPPDEAERLRNDLIQTYQGNRNPFIDHPEWVACIYQSVCN